MHRGTLWIQSPAGHVGDSNPESDDSNIDEGWDDEPDTGGGAPEVAAPNPVPAKAPTASAPPALAPAPHPASSAPAAAGSAANAWGPVPATTRPLTSSSPPGTSGAPIPARVAPPLTSPSRPVVTSRPTEPNRAIELKPAAAKPAAATRPAPLPTARAVEAEPQRLSSAAATQGPLPKSEPAAALSKGEPPPSKKAKFGQGPKDARVAKAAKKAAKKAARQAEKKARAKNNNKAAIRAAATAKVRQVDTPPVSMNARAGGQKGARSALPEAGRRTGGSQRDATSRTTSAVRSIGSVRAMSTTLLVLVAAVLVLGGLGWFLASRH